MKLAFLQANVSSDKIGNNARKIIEFSHWAKKNECDLGILPGETIFGVSKNKPNEELIFRTLNDLRENLPKDFPLLCSCANGEIQHVFIDNDMLLNTSEELFFKNRHFFIASRIMEPAFNFELPFFQIFPTSIPWRLNKYPAFHRELKKRAARSGQWILAPSIVGGYGQKVYDGQSVFINPAGEIVKMAASFTEEYIYLDTHKQADPIISETSSMEQLWQALVTGTRDFICKSGHSRALIGLSGGMDSAFTACVLVEALGAENVTGILMPSIYTSADSSRDALELANNLKIGTHTISIENIKNAYTETLAPVLSNMREIPDNLTGENLQARIRGAILMALSNYNGALVINTGNKSEGLMGYCTLYGDTVGALAVIGDLYKTQVYALAKWYCENIKNCIPENIFNKAPSAELKNDQKDEDTLPPYSELDPALAWILGETAESCENYERLREIRERVENNIFKRKLYPPALLVGYAKNIMAP